MAVKWGKFAFFKSEIEWLGFKSSGVGGTTDDRQSRCHQEFTNPYEHFGIAIVFRLDKSVRKIRPESIDTKFSTTSSVEQKICI